MSEEEQVRERYDLAIGRIRQIGGQETAAPAYRPYFQSAADFIGKLDAVFTRVCKKPHEACTLAQLRQENEELYRDIAGANYEKSFANPSRAAACFGEEMGPFLGALYAELRGGIAWAYEKRRAYLTILYELFIEIYNCFEREETPDLRELKGILYWYASDYSDVFDADRIEEQLDPSRSFAADIICGSDLTDLRYLYKYGEYISENEWKTAAYLNTLAQETIDQMADVYTEGYRRGFISAGIDLSKKETVNIRYVLGFERVIKKAIENFAAMGLKPVIWRSPAGILLRKQQKTGYYGGIASKQYEYDHRQDQGLILDRRLVERRLDVMKHTYERLKDAAAVFAGPAVMEVFGEQPFVPEQKKEAVALTRKQEALATLYDSRASELTNRYIRGDERSFTIVAYPVPEIGEKYGEIFQEVIRINTLDAAFYENVQQTLIDALDQGTYVRVLGRGANETDLKIRLHRLSDPEKETIFENCVADVNIPVGEVFTSPVLKGTEGVLHVGSVYLNGLLYRDLRLTFRDGMVTAYTCGNFEDEEACRNYVREHILHDHDTLPLGEFAIGTNTTAYAAAKTWQIEDKLPILIAEKMGPHFAVGDTCYSWSEENRLFNPNGKEIVAKDNEVSLLRRTDVSKAYFQCHTDITIPYEEIGRIAVGTADNREILLLSDGRFVLPGTEELNGPLDF